MASKSSKRFPFFKHELNKKLHGPTMLPDKAKFVVRSIISLALSFWMKHLVIGQLKNLLNSRLFIGQHLEIRLSLVSFWEPAG